MGGGPISRYGALSTACGRFVLAPAGAALRVYSCSTAAMSTTAAGGGRGGDDASCSSSAAGTLVSELLGHDADVTAVSRNPENDEQVYTASLDGTVRLWAWATGECLETFKVGVPITGMAVPPRTSLAYLSTSWAGGTAGRIMRLKLSSGQLEPERFKLSAAGGRLVLSAGGGVVAAFERRTLFAWRAAAPSLRRPLTLSGSKAFSAAAVDGDDDRLAVGDASGRITVWRGLAAALAAAAAAAASTAEHGGGGGGGSKRHAASGRPPPPPTSKLLPPLTLHWHSSAVRALCFSPDGELLLSGGNEGVLAWWRLAACAASVAGGVSAAASGGSRGFLPRLGGAITSIDAVRDTRTNFEGSCVLSQADNTIRKVNLATVEVEASVHGLRPRAFPSSPSSSSSGRGAAAVVDPFDAASPTAALCPLRSSPGDLVVAAPGSALQFWSSRRDAHAARLAVSRRNDVAAAVEQPPSSSSSSASNDAALAAANAVSASCNAPRVTGVAFSGDGRGMATAEAVPRPGAGSSSSGASGAAAAAAAAAGPPLAGRAGVLKLWASPSSGVSVAGEPPYALVAEVVDPHSGPIAALAFSPRGDAVATTGAADGELKLWSRRASPAGASPSSPPPPSTRDRWRCSWAAGLRSAPLTAVAFSADGSLVAAAAAPGGAAAGRAGPAVGLWRVDSGERVAVLAPPSAPSSSAAAAAAAVSCLAFVPGTAMLVAALSGPSSSSSSSSLVAWDLLTKAAAWAAPLGAGAGAVATRLAASPAGGVVAVALAPSPSRSNSGSSSSSARGGRVLALRARDGAALCGWDLPRAPADALLFEQRAGSVGGSSGAGGACPPLLVLTTDREFAVLDASSGAADSAAAAAAAAAKTSAALSPPLNKRARRDAASALDEPRSAFHAKFGGSDASSSARPPATPERGGASGGLGEEAPAAAAAAAAPWAALFDAPSHALPAPGALASRFLDSLLLLPAQR